MIEFASCTDMISCWDEAGRPLDASVLADIESTAYEMQWMGLDDKWLVFDGQCRICNFVQTIICPAENDIDNQECYNCGNMTMAEREIPEWEQDEPQP